MTLNHRQEAERLLALSRQLRRKSDNLDYGFAFRDQWRLDADAALREAQVHAVLALGGDLPS